MIIRNVVGPYPSRRINDYILIVDLVGPPKKCPYNCIYCPIGNTIVKTNKIYSLIPPKKIVEDFKYIIEKIGLDIKAVLFNGMGDPLLNYFLKDIVEDLKKINNELGADVEYWIKTTLVPLVYNNRSNVLKLFNKVFVIFDVGSREDYILINDPLDHIRLKDIIKYINNMSVDIVAEITLLKIDDDGNWRKESIELLASKLGKAGVEDIILKTLSRPPRSLDAKPVPKKILYNAKDYLDEYGFKVEVLINCIDTRYRRIVLFNETDLYNLLLRRPMDLLELHRSLGLPIRDIAYLLSRLESNKFIERIPWKKRIFYRCIYRR